MTDYDRMMERLDNTNPRWWAQWADQVDLCQLSLGAIAETTVRNLVALKLFGPIIAAAVDAGVCSYDR